MMSEDEVTPVPVVEETPAAESIPVEVLGVQKAIHEAVAFGMKEGKRLCASRGKAALLAVCGYSDYNAHAGMLSFFDRELGLRSDLRGPTAMAIAIQAHDDALAAQAAPKPAESEGKPGGGDGPAAAAEAT